MFKVQKNFCKARATIDVASCEVLEISGDHTCRQDPEQSEINRMEAEMKEVARTSVRSLREIYDSVCLTNPRLSVKILWPRMEAAMSKSRSTMIPKNPTDFNDVIRLLVASPIHNYNLKSTLTTTDENGKEDGALIFASAK